MDSEMWEFAFYSKVYDSSMRVGKYLYSGVCRNEVYTNVETPVCGTQQYKPVKKMISPSRMKLIDRSKYTPHQGKKEMERRVRDE